MLTRTRFSTWIWLVITLGVLPLVAVLLLEGAVKAAPAAAPKARFSDGASQAAEFIGYNRSITLTKEQRELRDAALAAVPAPCCSKFSAATCCCPCNLAKSIWGLSNAMIVREHASAGEVQKVAREWIRFVNGKGFTGDVCDVAGGCARSFSANGCGGMDEGNLLAAR